jgi:hypothetical protein
MSSKMSKRKRSNKPGTKKTKKKVRFEDDFESSSSSVILTGKDSQVPAVDEGDFELSKDDTEAEKFYRKRVTLAKVMKEGENVREAVENVVEGRRIPIDLEPFVFVNGDDFKNLSGEKLLKAMTGTTVDIFADTFSNKFSQRLIDSALCVSASKASKNLELSAINEEDLQEIDRERRSRLSDDKWLRTPREEIGERRCIKDDECEAYYWFGRHAVERVPDSEIDRLTRIGEVPTGQRHMCVMCQRFFRLKLVIATLQNCGNMADILPDFFNVVGIEGEYCMEQCFVGGGNPRGDPLFVAGHFPQCYRLEEREGVTYFVQDGYVKPEESNRPFV